MTRLDLILLMNYYKFNQIEEIPDDLLQRIFLNNDNQDILIPYIFYHFSNNYPKSNSKDELKIINKNFLNKIFSWNNIYTDDEKQLLFFDLYFESLKMNNLFFVEQEEFEQLNNFISNFSTTKEGTNFVLQRVKIDLLLLYNQQNIANYDSQIFFKIKELINDIENNKDQYNSILKKFETIILKDI